MRDPLQRPTAATLATARKRLAADYEVADLDGLLDEVYAKAGK